MATDTISIEEATRNAEKVYRVLLRQGRPELQARRDAERWVQENQGAVVTLEAPAVRFADAALDEIIRAGHRRRGQASVRRCIECNQPWPFTGPCEDCRRVRWAQERRNSTRHFAARKAAAKRKVNQARTTWERYRIEGKPQGVCDAAARRWQEAVDAYQEVCRQAQGL